LRIFELIWLARNLLVDFLPPILCSFHPIEEINEFLSESCTRKFSVSDRPSPTPNNKRFSTLLLLFFFFLFLR
jgi:hypothetical protein